MDSLDNKNRYVFKIGTSLLLDPVTETLNQKWISNFVKDVIKYKSLGYSFIFVVSGSVGVGRKKLKLKKDKLKISEKQAVAAVGQIEVIKCFSEEFAKHDQHIAQILLTSEDLDDRKRFINARQTLESLYKLDVLAVINENDTVTTSEIKIGDNDRLAAKVTQMMSYENLLIFSDVNGLYDDNPHTNPNAKLIPIVHVIDEDIEKLAGNPNSKVGTGGMITKIQAAKICNSSGARMIITSGFHESPLTEYFEKKIGTVFMPDQTPVSAKKKWLANSMNVKGEIILNENAIKALLDGKSILPVGVVNVIGNYKNGDIVKIVDMNRTEYGRGLVAYSASESIRIIGHRTNEFEDILGYKISDELIHRNDLVITKIMEK